MQVSIKNSSTNPQFFKNYRSYIYTNIDILTTRKSHPNFTLTSTYTRTSHPQSYKRVDETRSRGREVTFKALSLICVYARASKPQTEHIIKDIPNKRIVQSCGLENWLVTLKLKTIRLYSEVSLTSIYTNAYWLGNFAGSSCIHIHADRLRKANFLSLVCKLPLSKCAKILILDRKKKAQKWLYWCIEKHTCFERCRYRMGSSLY